MSDTQILMGYVCLVTLPPLEIDFSLVLWALASITWNQSFTPSNWQEFYLFEKHSQPVKECGDVCEKYSTVKSSVACCFFPTRSDRPDDGEHMP